MRSDIWRLVRRRAADAGIEPPIGYHTFRATGMTDYLRNGGRIEVAQPMAGHSNAKTTGLCDRRNDDISLDEVERIGKGTGITGYSRNAARIEVDQLMASHSNAKTTGLHDRRNDDISLER